MSSTSYPSRSASEPMSALVDLHQEFPYPAGIPRARTSGTVDKPQWMFFCGEWILDNGQW